jgi:hypothetical protein
MTKDYGTRMLSAYLTLYQCICHYVKLVYFGMNDISGLITLNDKISYFVYNAPDLNFES